MTDPQILKQMELSDKELRDLLGRLASAFDGLNEAQKNVMKATLPSLHEALQSFTGEITEQQLLEFLEERQPESGVVMLVRGTHRDEDNDEENEEKAG
jgi:hypothetical protein